jgi:hypothetical protein
MKIFIIVLFVKLTLLGSSLIKSGNYVIDDNNKLMWQDSLKNVNIRGTHEEVINYCEKLNDSGFTNWRLPTIKEYKTIIDKTRVKDQIMLHKSFKYVLRTDYWISDRTWTRNFGLYGYYIFIKSGSIYYQNRSYKKFVRCVREMK